MTPVTKEGKPRRRVGAGAPPALRILLHTDRAGDCWLWTGALSDSGYGRLTMGGKLRYAHRISYETFIGPITPGLQIDHLCRVPQCCNPLHLEAVTPQINVLRGESPGARALRRNDCLYGHPYVEHGVVSRGRRVCRLCRITYARLRKQVPYEEAMRRRAAGIPVVDLAAYFAEHPEETAA